MRYLKTLALSLAISLCGLTLAAAQTVTFQVNMQWQETLGNFDPGANHFVVIRGSFNNWSGNQHELQDPDGDGIYTLDVDFSAVAQGEVNYKFVRQPGDNWEADPNRSFTYAGTSMTLPVVWFDRQEPTGLTRPYWIYFTVDMNAMLLTENFDPGAGDVVAIRGGTAPLAWGSNEIVMTESATQPGIYEALVDFGTLGVPTTHQFKFIIQYADGTINWESIPRDAATGIDNRFFQTGLNDTDSDGDGTYELIYDQVAPHHPADDDFAFFNGLTTDDFILQDVAVTFYGDLSAALEFISDDDPTHCLGDVQTGTDLICDPSQVTSLYVNGGSAVLGNWGSWGNLNPAQQMTLVEGETDLYKITITFPRGHAKRVEYKYGINMLDNDGGFGQNRILEMDDSQPTMELPIDCVGDNNGIVDYPACTDRVTTVTFHVNMQWQETLGNFNPDAGDFVVIRGSFNNWSGNQHELLDPDGDGIYTLEVDFTDVPQGEVNYKFVRQPGDNWEADPNRSFTFAGEDMDLDLVWFDRQEPTGLTRPYWVYFTVDMNAMILTDNFDPGAGDVVAIRGGTAPLAWGSNEIVMTESATQPGIYEALVDFGTLGVPTTHQFKYIIQSGDAITWESIPRDAVTGIDNRFFMTGLNDDDSDGDGIYELIYTQAAPHHPTDDDFAFFNGLTTDDFILQDVAVTFRADLSAALEYISDSDPAHCLGDVQTGTDLICDPSEVQSVYINGGSPVLGNWGSWGNLNPAQQMTQPNSSIPVYHITVAFPRGHAKRVEYKYGVNMLDNDGAFGQNRILEMDDSQASMTLDVDCVGDNLNLPDFPECQNAVEDPGQEPTANAYFLRQNYPNPFRPATVIAFALPKTDRVSLKVFDVDGRLVRTVVDQTMDPGYHEVRFDGKNMPSGVYFYQLESGSFSETRKMVMMK